MTRECKESGEKDDHQGHAGNLSKANSDCQDANHHYRNALKNNFDGHADRKKHADCRKCMLENGRTRKREQVGHSRNWISVVCSSNYFRWIQHDSNASTSWFGTSSPRTHGIPLVAEGDRQPNRRLI